MRLFSAPLARCLALALMFHAADAGAQLRAGTRAPEVELNTLQGASFKLSALRGHPVVMTFWGTWCPPCKEEFPALGELYREQHPAGLEVVGVNQRDQEVSTSDVQKFVTDFGTPFPVVLDARGRSRRAYRLIGLPTTVFIDTAGVVAHVVSGPVSAELLETGLKAIGVKRR